MNKETKLQLIELLKETRSYLDVEDAPEYDSLDFMPIASDRETHTEAILALASDLSSECETQVSEPTSIAVEVTAD